MRTLLGALVLALTGTTSLAQDNSLTVEAIVEELCFNYSPGSDVKLSDCIVSAEYLHPIWVKLQAGLPTEYMPKLFSECYDAVSGSIDATFCVIDFVEDSTLIVESYGDKYDLPECVKALGSNESFHPLRKFMTKELANAPALLLQYRRYKENGHVLPTCNDR